VEGSSIYAGANNSARLQGPLIGDGSVANNDILRSLPFRVAAADPGLELRGLVNFETGFLNVYMLDERGVVLGSALASSDEQLAPGAEAVLNARVGHFPGQVSSIRVLVDFDNI